ncbi:MAG: hypothetical protein ACYCT9_07465 [Leptospirillum sp.]
MNSFDDMGGKKILWGLLVFWIGLLYLAHSMETGSGTGNSGLHQMLPSGPSRSLPPDGGGRSPHSGGDEGAVGPPHFQPTSIGR